ncbi:MAG: ABC transporter permease [Alphaproteobacteria bacterium]
MKYLKTREFFLLFAWVFLIVLTGMITPNFLTIQGLRDLGTDVSILIILALAQMPVLIVRGIDLSVASNLAFTGMVVALIATVFPELPTISWLLLALLVGSLIGMLNGFLIAYIQIPAIVVTLGTMSVWRGMIFIVSGGAWIVQNQFPKGYLDILRTQVLGMTLFTWIALLVAVIAFIIAQYTKYGREIYGYGGNPLAAEYVGVPIKKRLFCVYTFSGLLAGLCGWLWTSRYAMANTDIAFGFELQTVAACVIGGIAISGGKGGVIGCVLGAMFLGSLYNVLPIIGVNQFWQQALSGVIILVAVLINQLKEKPAIHRILEVRES